jgi:hypothetical protein
MPHDCQVRENLLLAALPEEVLERLIPHLEPVAMPAGKVLHEPGSPLGGAWFPTTSFVS